MANAPTKEYVLELVDINSRLDAIGIKCENLLIKHGYKAYAQTKKRLELILEKTTHLNYPTKQLLQEQD